jgi:DNA repair protein RadD
MALREYQQIAVNETRLAWQSGKKAVCLIAPTGAGKTVMAEELLKPAKFGLCLVHTKVLLEQTAKRIPNAITTTVQSLIAEGAAGDKRRERLKQHDIVFIDECHHLAGEEWSQAMPLLAHAKVFGCTATPARADGTPLGDVFDHMVVAAKYSELVEAGYLCRCDVVHSEIRRKDQVKQKLRPDGVSAYLENAKRPDGSWKAGVYFDSTIALCQDAVDRFKVAGVRAALVCCDTNATDRQALFDAYNNRQLDVLASPMALSEGFDAPRAEVCVLRRSCEHLGTYLQIVGRVLRPHPDKERAMLIDLTNARELHGLPTDDRNYSLDGKGISAVEMPIDEEHEPIEKGEWQTVASKYAVIRDNLRDRFRDLQERAREAGYKPGWVLHRFKEATGIPVPMLFSSKYKSVCKHCRKRVELNSEIFWEGTGRVFHVDCWPESLDERVLDACETVSPA